MPTTMRIRRRPVLAAVGAGAAMAVAGCLSANEDLEAGNETETDDSTLPAPRDVTVETIAADPTDVPDPVDWTEPRHHEWELRTEEHVAEIEPGVTHRFMTFDGRVPGPMFRARVGDTVRLTFDVPEDLNADVHNVDFHAVYGPGGGAIDTTIAPGEGPVEIEFRLEYPGAHIYHCAPGLHDYHVSTGMFGTILVEPEEGLPEVDRELYLGQHELYTGAEAGEEGDHAFDFEGAAAEDPTYVLFNGEAGRYTENGESGPLHAEVGETVRVYWCNGGPNLTSTPHPIGNVWSRWYDNGDLLSEPAQYVEGASLPPGATAVGEMELVVPGPIFLVDHALSRVVHKGTVATIDVEGTDDEDIYDGDP